jgi:hypothetical protein
LDARSDDFTFGGNITVNNDQLTQFVNHVGGLDVPYEGVNASVAKKNTLGVG